MPIEEIYYALPPKKLTTSIWGKIKQIGLKLVFPPLLIWDGLTLILHPLIGKLVGNVILQPTSRADFKKLEEHGYLWKPKLVLKEYPNLDYKMYQVVTHDQCQLENIEIFSLTQKELDNADKKYVISFLGIIDLYQSEEKMCAMWQIANELQCNVIGFNYRGVGINTGRASSQHDLAIDGIAQIQRLLSKGVKPENITLLGHSLGGAVATLVAQYFHNQNQKVYLFNDRSFSNLTNVIVGKIRAEKNSGYKENFFGKFLGILAWPFIKSILILSRWEINASDTYRSLPNNHKQYSVIRTTTEKRNNKNIVDDLEITHYGSLHSALKKERQPLKRKAVSDQSVAEELKSRKMELAADEEEYIKNVHNVSLSKLKSRSAHVGTGFTLFKKFVMHDSNQPNSIGISYQSRTRS